MVGFLLAACFLGFLAIAGTASVIGGHAQYHGRSVGLWIVAFVWLVAVPSGCRESTQPKGMNIGVLVVHRTLWDRLLLRHRTLDPSAERTFEIGASGTRFRNTRLFGRQKLVFAMQNTKMIVSRDIYDKFGKTIAVIEDGRLRTMDHKVDFNYKAGAFIKFLVLKSEPDEPHIEPLFLYPGKLNIGRYAKTP